MSELSHEAVPGASAPADAAALIEEHISVIEPEDAQIGRAHV